MAVYTVTEHWIDPHTQQCVLHSNEFRIRLHFKLDDMQATGDFVRNPITGDRSVYASDGSPTKIFTSRHAAEHYDAWLRQEYQPHAIIIREWRDLDAIIDYLQNLKNRTDRSVRTAYLRNLGQCQDSALDWDPDHINTERGPTAEDKRQYLIGLGLDPDDPTCPRKIVD